LIFPEDAKIYNDKDGRTADPRRGEKEGREREMLTVSVNGKVPPNTFSPQEGALQLKKTHGQKKRKPACGMNQKKKKESTSYLIEKTGSLGKGKRPCENKKKTPGSAPKELRRPLLPWKKKKKRESSHYSSNARQKGGRTPLLEGKRTSNLFLEKGSVSFNWVVGEERGITYCTRFLRP